MNTTFKTYTPEGFSTLNSYLFTENPEELIQFLKNSFYAEEINRSINTRNNSIGNCILKIGDTCFMISQARGEFMNMRTAFYLYVEDVDSVYENAIRYGALNSFEPEDMDYDDRQAGIIDTSGNYWFISKRLLNKGYHE